MIRFFRPSEGRPLPALQGMSEQERITKELTEKQPLPTGVTEFHAWADRIISGCGLSATPESLKFALANELLHCPPNMAFETDVYFIHRLRKYAVNQVADSIRNEIRARVKMRITENQENKTPAAVTPPLEADAKVLDIPGVSETK